MSTMSFGKRTRLRFSAAGLLKSFVPERGPAIYAITYKQDPDGRPKAHTVVYFGETDDLLSHSQVIHNDMKHWWHDYGDIGSELFIFICPMPGSSQLERANIQRQLVHEYDPAANH